jgi:drug/metabolite transporter (DMT)-like permease
MKQDNKRKLGMLFAVGAAVCYGMSGIIGKLAYSGGGSTFTILTYRNLLSIPMLYMILKMSGISIRVTKRQLAGLAYIGIQGSVITAVLLYSSFQYISVGLASCTHFCFPAIVACIYVFIFKEKMSKTKITALIISIIGVWFFLENNTVVNPKGIALALGSGLSNAIFLTAMDKLNLKSLNGFVISFYCCIFSAIVLVAYGALGGFHLAAGLQPMGWLLVFVAAILISALANAMVPAAVKNVGPTVSGIFGILEPVIAVVLSVVILRESFSLRSVLGAAFVLAAAGMLTLEKEIPDQIQKESIEEAA